LLSEVNSENKENENQVASCIDFDDFLIIMEIKLMEKESDEEISKAFELFVDPKMNEITFDSLKEISKQIGETVTDEELCLLLKEANGYEKFGNVDKNQFIEIIKNGYSKMNN
jgi:Ca2+-binding EF-hand superfamily protein